MGTGQSRPASLLLTSNVNDDACDGDVNVQDADDGDVEDVDDDPPHTRFRLTG